MSTNIFSSIHLVVHETPFDSKKDDYDDKSMSIEEEKNMYEEKDIIGVEKNKSINIVNVDDLDSDDEHIVKRLALVIAKRLSDRIWKVVASASKPSKAPKKSDDVGPAKGWSKVVAPTKKRKEAPSSDSEYNVK